MEFTINLLSFVCIILGLVAATLAIAAFIFSWKSFKSSSKMQMKAQELLTKVAENVSVALAHTSQQTDKAWDFFTSPANIYPYQTTEETQKKEAELIEKIKKDARTEAKEGIKKLGLKTEQTEELLSKVDLLIEKTTERTENMAEHKQLLRYFSLVENQSKLLAESYGMKIDKRASMSDILKFLDDKISPIAMKELDWLIETRNMLTQKGIEVLSKNDINKIIGTSAKVLSYLFRKTER